MWSFWNERKWYVCEKKVTLMDAKEDFDKICIEVQTTSDNAGGQPTWGFSLQHKTFSALNYAQDFGTTVKESLKRTASTKWVTLTKSRIAPAVSNTFMPLSALSTMSRSPIGANSDWIHQLNSKNNGPVFFIYDYILALIMFLVVCGNGLQAIKNGLKLEPTVRSIQSTRYQGIQFPGHTYNKIQDIQQPDNETDSVQIMKVPKKATLK